MMFLLRILNIVATVIIGLCVSKGMSSFVELEWLRIVFNVAIVVVAFIWVFITNSILKLLGSITGIRKP